MSRMELNELRNYATRLADVISPRKEGATIITLSGELGAGKTTFAQAFAKALGVEVHVTSPTFVIEKIYELDGQKFERLIHIDAYRLTSAEELLKLGWNEIAANPGNLILMEWPERVPELAHNAAMQVRIDIDGDGRIISINGEKTEEN